MSWLSGITSTIKTSIQEVAESSDKATDIFNKLSLQTPELTAERERIDAEERHKEQVQNYLSELLPWETRDEDRSILVDECREAILSLSLNKETFLGPYAMPEEEEEGGDDDGKGKLLPGADKLEELKPLPPLLGDFDIDMHVGLIQRMLTADPKLVEMQSALAGAGEKESTFWRNYFFHCAYTRYQSGMSVDEIWAPKSSPGPTTAASGADSTASGLLGGSSGALVSGLLEGVRSAVIGQAQAAASSTEENIAATAPSSTTAVAGTTENTVVPTPTPLPAAVKPQIIAQSRPTSNSLPPQKDVSSVPSSSIVEKPKNSTIEPAASSLSVPAATTTTTTTTTTSTPKPSNSSSMNDFEVIHQGEGGVVDEEEIDGLEAEIAKELEEW